MTIPFVKPGGWAINEKLTSNQIEDVDEHITWALDKRSGETDDLESDITLSGSLTLGSTGSIVTGTGLIDVNSDGGITVGSNGNIIHLLGGLSTFRSGSAAVFDAGSVMAISGAVNHIADATTTYSGSSNLNIEGGGSLFADTGTSVTLFSTNILSGPTTITNASTINATNLTVTGNNHYKVNSRTSSRSLGVLLTPLRETAGSTILSLLGSTILPNVLSIPPAVTTNAFFMGMLDLPDGAVLNSIFINAVTANVVATGDAFTVELYKRLVTVTNVKTLLGSDSIPAASSTGSNDITINVSETIDRSAYEYFIFVRAFTGNASNIAITMSPIMGTMTITRTDEFAA